MPTTELRFRLVDRTDVRVVALEKCLDVVLIRSDLAMKERLIDVVSGPVRPGRYRFIPVEAIRSTYVIFSTHGEVYWGAEFLADWFVEVAL